MLDLPNKKGKVLCFGEILLRFSPQLGGAWIQQNAMPFYVGGAELNVATALANWQIPVGYCTALPENALSEEIKNYINEKNIDTSAIQNLGDRIGIYYLPQGADLKNAGVIYDRAFSSFASLEIGKINIDEILEDVSWLHFSAISPALNQAVADVCLELVKVASSKNITISIDLNYRSKLWKYGKNPIEIMPTLVSYCDVIMGNVWAAKDLLGIEIEENVNQHQVDKNGYLAQSETTAKAIQKQFPTCKVLANTFRFDAFQGGIHYYTTLHQNNKSFVSPEFSTEKVIDKVGSGDCFMAGLIYGLYQNHAPQELLNFATAAAFGKLNEIGDATQQSIEIINASILKK